MCNKEAASSSYEEENEMDIMQQNQKVDCKEALERNFKATLAN